MGIELTPAVTASGVTIEAVAFAYEPQPDGTNVLRLLVRHVVTDDAGNRVMVNVLGVDCPPDMAAAVDAFLKEHAETAAKEYDISPASVTAMPAVTA